MPDDDLIDRATTALEGITDCPWVWERNTLTGGEGAYDEVLEPGPVDCMSHCYGGTSTINTDRAADREFIAAARTLVPELLDALVAAHADNERLRAENARPRLSDAAMAAATQDDPTPCITCGHPRAEHGDGVVHTACCGVFPPAGSDLDEIECECDEFEADDEDGAR